MKIKDLKKEANNIKLDIPDVYNAIKPYALNKELSKTTKKSPQKKHIISICSSFAVVLLAICLIIPSVASNNKKSGASIPEEPSSSEGLSPSIIDEYINSSDSESSFNIDEFINNFEGETSGSADTTSREIFYFLYNVKINDNVEEFIDAFTLLQNSSLGSTLGIDYLNQNKETIKYMFDSIKK